MKTSREHSDLLDLERDLPTTEDDIRVLRERRTRPSANWLDELQALHDQFAGLAARRQRRTFEGFEPFEL